MLRAIRSAYEDLIKVLDPAIDTYDRYGQFGYWPPVVRGVERFVAAIKTAPRGFNELVRRALFVRQISADGSLYGKARLAVVATAPADLPWLSLGDEPIRHPVNSLLGDSHKDLALLSGVVATRNEIKESLNDDKIRSDYPEAFDALNKWLDVCGGIIDYASPQEVDGCYYLHQIKQAERSDCDDEAINTMGWLLSPGIGGLALTPFRRAADSIVEWVQLYDPEPSACPPALFDERKRREIESTREGEAIDRRYAGIRDAQGGVLTEEQSLEYKALRNDLQQRVDATEQLDKGAMPPPNPASATSSDFFLPDSEPQKDHDADGEVANVGGQGTNAGSRRRPRSNLADDRQIANAWKTGRYKTYADLASTIGRTKNQVKLAVDRYRKRTSRRNR